MNNCGPARLTSVLCMMMERLIRAHLPQYLTEHSIFCPARHSFINNRFCFTNISCFLDEVPRRLYDGKQVEVCYLDFGKTLDSVNLRPLLVDLG